MPYLDQPLVCPIVIGRDGARGLIERAMDEASAGHGRVLCLHGEAGVGKTRMVSVTRELAAERGWSIAQGAFFEPDKSLPFSGIIDLVRAWLAAAPQTPSPAIARLLPELADDRGVGANGEAQDKRLLFRSLSELLLSCRDEKPALVVLEDLHWADDASLEFLLYFARLVPAATLLLVLTYRTDEVQPQLARLLAGLERERLLGELPLGRLTRSEVDRMLRSILDRTRPVRPDVLHAIHELTDGNPFFVEEVLKSMVGSNATADLWDQEQIAFAPIPRSVDESVRRRSAALDEQTRRVLEVAAVTGRRFDFPLLQDLTGLDEAQLMAAIKQLIAAQLVSEDSFDQFSFRHALTRQAVTSGLLLRERRLLHQRISSAIAVLYAASLEEHCEDLAYHAFEAQDWPAAVDYYRQAGARALRLYSPGTAVEHFGRALDAARRDEASRCGDLRRARGNAYETLGDFNAALADYEAALAEATECGDRHDQWQALLDIGMLWTGREYTRAGEYLERAHAQAHQMEEPRLIAASLNRVGNWLANVDRPQEGVAVHQRALAIYKELADEAGVAATLDLLGMASLLGADFVNTAAYLREALPLFEKLNDRMGLASSLTTIPIAAAPDHVDCGAPAFSMDGPERAYGERALYLTKQIGWRSGESYAHWEQAHNLGGLGRYDEAFAMAREGLAIAEEIEHTQWQSAAANALGHLYLDVLDSEQARRYLEQALQLARLTGSGMWIKVSVAPLVRALLALDEIALAEALVEPFLAQRGLVTIGQRQIDASLAELRIAEGDPAEALATIDVLEAVGPGYAEYGPVARISFLRGQALEALGRDDAARSAFEQALTAGLRDGRVGIVWRAQAALATLYARQGDVTSAARASTAAETLVRQLALNLSEPALCQTFVSRALGRLPHAAPPAPRPAGQGPLTARESEIASLVALGMSNRAIAERLVLSERTVETHVANALSKLGYSSRSQLAVWASQQAS